MCISCRTCCKFQSTLPTRGSDTGVIPHILAANDFNPRCPRGAATGGFSNPALFVQLNFNPRCPRGAATGIKRVDTYSDPFQSTLPTRGSDIPPEIAERIAEAISIHAAHEGQRPGFCARAGAVMKNISIHAAHEGQRPALYAVNLTLPIFQSTLPTRGSDSASSSTPLSSTRISIHAAHEGQRQHGSKVFSFVAAISIHAAHEGQRPASFMVVAPGS